MPVSSLRSTLVAAMAATFATAAAAGPVAVDNAYARIQQAHDRGDIDALEQVVRELDAGPDKSADTLLAAAVGDYRIAGAGQRDPEHLKPRIDAAIGRVQARLAPWTQAGTAIPDRTRAEGLALLASMWGLRIGMDLVQGRVLGRQAADALRQAEGLAPDDPRVALARGIQLLFIPALFGGDRTEALQSFEHVAALIPRARASAANWGLDDAWIWRGVALRSLHRPDEARAAFQQALDIAPASGFAQALLRNDRQLPGASKAD